MKFDNHYYFAKGGYLQLATKNFSRQREAIITFLESRKDHPTADVIYTNLRETMPNISLGTVYRNLNQLAESGDILKLHGDDKFDHFDACTKPHGHFICTSCNAFLDINTPSIETFLADTIHSNEHQINDVSMIFTGICSECKKKEE